MQEAILAWLFCCFENGLSEKAAGLAVQIFAGVGSALAAGAALVFGCAKE